MVTRADCYKLLSLDTLVHCEITAKNITLDIMQQLITQANTQNNYTQIKFNLMREENEGYAKLLMEVNQENISDENVHLVMGNI